MIFMIYMKKETWYYILSTVKHFASCVSKKIEYPPILAINNGIPVHNPNNIEANKIKYYLNTKYPIENKHTECIRISLYLIRNKFLDTEWTYLIYVLKFINVMQFMDVYGKCTELGKL